MGSARNFSWSHSRHELYQKCPRAMFYEFYPWGETAPHEDVLAFFKRSTNVPMLAGKIVHDFISMALRNFQFTGNELVGLEKVAVKRYDEIVNQSLKVAKRVRLGRKPQCERPMLMHHYEMGALDSALEEQGRDTIRQSLEGFFTSAAWAAIRRTDRTRWEYVDSDSNEKPSFIATEQMGFAAAVGVKIYTAFDLCVRDKGAFIIVDWKTGRKTIESERNAREQLATYALWALAEGKRLSHVKVQAVFLGSNEAWKPTAFTPDESDQARERIESHVATEKTLTHEGAESQKRLYHAHAAKFPIRAKVAVCSTCKYRVVCPGCSENAKSYA